MGLASFIGGNTVYSTDLYLNLEYIVCLYTGMLTPLVQGRNNHENFIICFLVDQLLFDQGFALEKNSYYNIQN